MKTKVPRRRLRNGRGPKPAQPLDAPNPLRGFKRETLEDVLKGLGERLAVNAAPRKKGKKAGGNCGTGAGGFQPGNTCGSGDGGLLTTDHQFKIDVSADATTISQGLKKKIEDWAASRGYSRSFSTVGAGAAVKVAEVSTDQVKAGRYRVAAFNHNEAAVQHRKEADTIEGYLNQGQYAGHPVYTRQWVADHREAADTHDRVAGFLRGKGKLVEVDWRPDEVIPEDFYANVARPPGRVGRLGDYLHGVMDDVTKGQARTIASVVLKSHRAGLTPEETAEVLVRSAGLETDRALLVARTELTRVAAEEAREGHDRVRFRANADACPLCRKLHGKVYKGDKSAGKIPVHPGCHCKWEPVGEPTANVDEDGRPEAVADVLVGLFGANASRLVDLDWVRNPDGTVVWNTAPGGPNCGVGPGGFQPGNTCASGGGGRGKVPTDSMADQAVKDKKVRKTGVPVGKPDDRSPAEYTREEYEKLKVVYHGGTAGSDHVYVTNDPTLAAQHGPVKKFRLKPGSTVYADPEVEEELRVKGFKGANINGFNSLFGLPQGSGIVSRESLWPGNFDDRLTANKFNPGQKRDNKGRWTRGAGAARITKPAARQLAYDQARAVVRSFLTAKGKKPSPAQAMRLSKALDDLTVPQIKQLAAEYGLEAKGRAKAVVLGKLRDGLEFKRRPQGEEKAKEKEGVRPPEPTPLPGGKPGGGKPGGGTGGVEPVGGGPEGKVKPGGREGDAGPRPDQNQPPPGGLHDRVPADVTRVNAKIDRMKGFLDKKLGPGSEQAQWLDKLKEHVNTVGVAGALEGIGGGQVAGRGLEGGAQYEGGWVTMSEFAHGYLARNGITTVGWEPGDIDPAKRVVSSMSPSFGSLGETLGKGRGKDFFPADPKLKDKLAEAKHLPGLEKSEDINVLMGRKVAQLTPDVVAKLDSHYGQDKWIVKTYGDEAYAGNGVFFPQRARQVTNDARGEIWASGGPLAKYGFKHHRDAEGNVVGIEHEGGDVYLFGTKRYDHTINGEVRHWADRAAAAAPDERGAALPFGGKDFMAQPAFDVVGISDADRARGVTIKPGEEGRVHLITRDGKTEIVPHTTWLKQQPLPVVFETPDTRAMAKAAKDAIDALPPSERQGQIYAADVVRTKDGYRVVEANPANNTGSSGYLGDNPLIIDSFVSHVTGRTPAHVRMVRQLLTERGVPVENAGKKKKGSGDNCGVGPGGFQPGNTCAGGGGGLPTYKTRDEARAAAIKIRGEIIEARKSDPSRVKGLQDRMAHAWEESERLALAAPKLGPKVGKDVATKLADLHNRAYKEYEAEFKKIGARLWHGDKARPLKSKEIKGITETLSGLPDLKSVAGIFSIVHPLTVLDSYPAAHKHRGKLRTRVEAIHKKYQKLWEAELAKITTNTRKGGGADCGTGSGGFKPGNTCGRGEGSAAGLHLGDDEPFAPPAEKKASLKVATAKVKSAPVPTKTEVDAGREDLRKARLGLIRAGGEKRGNSNDRKVRAKSLFREFGGDERGYVVCPWTGLKMHWSNDPKDNPNGYPRFEQGKIFTACQGGRYKLANLIPESFEANRSRNDKRLRPENSKGC